MRRENSVVIVLTKVNLIFMAERNNKTIVGEPQVHIETDPELVSKKEKLLQKRQIIRRTGCYHAAPAPVEIV